MQGPEERGQGIVGALEVQRAGDGRVRAAFFTKSKRIFVAASTARATGILAIAIAVSVVVAILVP